MTYAMKLGIRWLLPLVLAAGLAAAACGSDDEPQAEQPAAAAAQTEAEPQAVAAAQSGAQQSGGGQAEPAMALAGDISVDGSSTVYPITEAMAAEFGILHSDVRVTVGVSGTGGGFKRFCVGETDISDASRPIKDAEAEICAENGVDFIELPVAYDGLTVVIHPDNDWVDQLTAAELNHIFRPEDYAVTWADVRAGFPEVEIALFAPGADSGTFDYFTETINGDGGVHRSENTTFSEDDNVLVQGVSGERGGIGYFGFSYYANNSERLRAVPIVNDAGAAVLPSLETINTGTYNPLSRPLFIYVSAASLDRAEVAAFVEYYVTDGVFLVDSPEVGYVQLPAEIYAAALGRVQNRIGGSAIGNASEGESLGSIYGAG